MSGPTPSNDHASRVFDLIGDEYEQVDFLHDTSTGLRAIVAVHSTVLGPAMGGTRFLPYPTEADALVDVLRLARGMTYKQAVAGIDFGGGKAVIVGAPAEIRTNAMLRAYGRLLHRLGGTYLTAEDVGTTQADMDLIRTETPYVTGTSLELGGSGDPSPATAWGLLHAMRATGERVWGDSSLVGRHVIVSGVGKVGRALVGHLLDEGARVSIADPHTESVATVAADAPVEVVDHRSAHEMSCDIWSPCALGAVLDADTIPMLGASAVCGAANNQLATPGDAERIAESGVLYVPDFVANAGGVINISEESAGYDRDRAFEHVEVVYENTRRVLDRAATDRITTAAAAESTAEDRIAAAAGAQLS